MGNRVSPVCVKSDSGERVYFYHGASVPDNVGFRTGSDFGVIEAVAGGQAEALNYERGDRLKPGLQAGLVVQPLGVRMLNPRSAATG